MGALALSPRCGLTADAFNASSGAIARWAIILVSSNFAVLLQRRHGYAHENYDIEPRSTICGELCTADVNSVLSIHGQMPEPILGMPGPIEYRFLDVLPIPKVAAVPAGRRGCLATNGAKVDELIARFPRPLFSLRPQVHEYRQPLQWR